jgi:YD repeat-containing protein
MKNLKIIPILALLLIFFSGAWHAANSATYSYDDAGRLVSADYGGGQVITYSYDATGNITSVLAENPDNTLKVGVSPSNGGSVTGNGIDCPGDCEESFSASPSVSLTANPETDYKLLQWAEDAMGTENPVSISMDNDKNILAYFAKTDGNTDNDNLPDVTEMGPSGTDYTYDGDGNGVPDYQESGAGSLSTNVGDSYATLSVSAGYALENIQTEGNPSPGDSPADTDFPYGFFSFDVVGLDAGQCVDVVLILPLNYSISGYYKFGPEPGDPVPHWYLFNYNGETGAEIFHEADRTRIVLHLCDALRGDDNPVEDSKIFDVGGPSTAANAEADIHVTPMSLNFGPIETGDSSVMTVKITNQGGGTLALGPVAGTNPLEAPFAITSDNCSDANLINSETCTITVTYSPTTKGRFSDSFDIVSDDAGETPLTVYVNGSGATDSPPLPDIQVVPLSVDYGEVDTGNTKQMAINVSNQGLETLVIGNIGASNPLSAPFDIVSDTCSGISLDNGGTCSVTASFSPKSDKSYSDAFDIPSNDPDEPSVTVQVQGDGRDENVQIPVPSLNQWGFMILMGLLIVCVIVVIRRKNMIKI